MIFEEWIDSLIGDVDNFSIVKYEYSNSKKGLSFKYFYDKNDFNKNFEIRIGLEDNSLIPMFKNTIKNELLQSDNMKLYFQEYLINNRDENINKIIN